jgi:hypothetical protein
MKLPNGDRAVVDIAKLTDYCLNPYHLRGRHKAYVFERALGITQHQAEDLRQMLLTAARTEEAVPGPKDDYGQRYVVNLEIETAERTVVVRSAWIIRTGEDVPRFTSCYVLEEGAR